VAQAVVNGFEPVEVDQQDRQTAGVAATDLYGVLEAIVEQSAVGEPGERVVERLMSNLRLGLFLVVHDVCQAQYDQSYDGDRGEGDGEGIDAFSQPGLTSQQSRPYQCGPTQCPDTQS
jgi:hypothetical protein